MFGNIKKSLYFAVANYFRFFARIKLWRWQPRVIVITGSNGKTTLLHLMQSQLKSLAKYSHLANSAYGIPFNILGLQRKTLTLLEWPYLFLMAPFQAFTKVPQEKIYVVEADCDRPHEGQFLASLLKPEAIIWLSVSQTHSMNFRSLDRIAFEFGYFLQYSQKLALVNGDDNLIIKQLSRSKAEIKQIHKKSLQKYQVIPSSATRFKINNKEYSFNFLLPEDTFYAIQATEILLQYLEVKEDITFKGFTLPPGRNLVLHGIKDITIIDSSYNASPASMTASLNMYKLYPADQKWAVIADMLEQGKEEKKTHQDLAKLIATSKLDKVILMGPRVTQYTLPILKEIAPRLPMESFQTPKEVLDYLQDNINGGETIFFKGARFLEGVIEHLLKDKTDVNKLCRREKVWVERRKKWGL